MLTSDSSTAVYDANGNVIQTTDANGNVVQYVYDPLNRQVQENWLSSVPVGVPASAGSPFHTTSTYYDADGQTLGVVEADSQNPADAASYECSYDADGNMLTSRMAPGGFTQSGVTVDSYTTESLSTSSSTIDWTKGASADPYVGNAVALTAGAVVMVSLTSAAFDPVAFAQPPGGNIGYSLFDENSLGNGNAWMMFTVGAGQAGTWTIGATSTSPTASGSFVLTVTIAPATDANPLVPTALAVLTYTYLCSCQPRGADFFRMFREVRSRGAGWLSFSHRSMAA